MAAAEDGLILLVGAPVTCTDVFDDGRLLKHGRYQPGPGTSHTDFLNFFATRHPPHPMSARRGGPPGAKRTVTSTSAVAPKIGAVYAFDFGSNPEAAADSFATTQTFLDARLKSK